MRLKRTHRCTFIIEQENDNNEERMNKTTVAIQEVQNLLAQGGVEDRVRHPGKLLDTVIVIYERHIYNKFMVFGRKSHCS